MNVRFYLSYDIKITLKFWRKNVIILSLHTQRCYGRHKVALDVITSGLSILLHGVISLPDMTSCDKRIYFKCKIVFPNPSIYI